MGSAPSASASFMLLVAVVLITVGPLRRGRARASRNQNRKWS
jgi:hypothetical protein